MKLRVLGKYGRFPVAQGGTSSFIVSSEATVILDMGCSSISNMLKYIKVEEIDAVIISHLHGDHIADLKAFSYMVNIMLNEGSLTHSIRLYLPTTPEHLYSDLLNSKGLEIIAISDGMKDRVKDIELDFISLVHPVETYGVRLTAGGKVLSYTADTLICDNLSILIKEADLVLGDACMLNKNYKDKSVHLSVKQLAEVCKHNYVKKLLLAHLPDKDTYDIYIEAKKYFTNSRLAEEGEEYEL